MDEVVSPTVRRIVGPTILLNSGSYFDFVDPAGCTFTIDDVAHGLSMTCRFAGQCRDFYSVAQHSVLLSEIVPEEDAYAGLMHDAAEAFVEDMSRPLKDLVAEYRVVEKRVEAAVFARFGVPCPLPASVKEADIVMLATEQRQLMRNRDDWNYTRGRATAPITITSWSPAEAEARFLDRHAEISARGGRP